MEISAEGFAAVAMVRMRTERPRRRQRQPAGHGIRAAATTPKPTRPQPTGVLPVLSLVRPRL